MSDEIERAMGHAAGQPGQPKVLHQVVITLLEGTGGATMTNLHYTCDELLARGLIDKGRAILDFKIDQENLQALALAQQRIALPKNGDVRRFG